MLEEKGFKKMNKNELKQLFKEANAQIDSIKSFSNEIEKIRQAITDAQIEKKSKEINDVYKELIVDDEEGESVKTQLENFLSEFEGHKKKLDDLQNTIFGHVEIDATGKQQKVKGLFDKINEFHQKQEEKYTALYKQIEEELKAGTTSVNLSKSFADKVSEYHKNSRFWSWCFVLLLLILIAYYGIVTLSTDEVKTIQDVWRHLGFRFPFLVFGVWLAIFFGNRRAESKKLEELYKHKEVMARAFVGYKKTLEELGDEDETLLKQHMANLIKAIGENSAAFLDSEGDKHPIFEAITSLLRKNKRNE